MTTFPTEPRVLAKDVVVSETELTVILTDARTITLPLAWFPRLQHASAAARARWELLGDGEGIHWPDADEDLSVAGLISRIGSRGAA